MHAEAMSEQNAIIICMELWFTQYFCAATVDLMDERNPFLLNCWLCGPRLRLIEMCTTLSCFSYVPLFASAFNELRRLGKWPAYTLEIQPSEKWRRNPIAVTHVNVNGKKPCPYSANRFGMRIGDNLRTCMCALLRW